MTQKEIKEEIARFELELKDLEDISKHCPEYIELRDKANKMSRDYFESIREKRNNYNQWISDSKKELKRLKESKELQLPEHVTKWFRTYGSGIDWGYNKPKIVWLSPDEKWVIITNKGGTAGQGTAQGTGGYYYSSTEHFLARVDGGRYFNGRFNGTGNSYNRVEGRLTVEVKQKLIDSIEELEKTLNL